LEEEQDERGRMEREDEKFEKELEKLAKAREEQEKRRKEELKRLYEEARKREEKRKGEQEKKEGQKFIGGQPVEQKKVFSRKIGVFRHNKLNNFNTGGMRKIDRALKRVTGVSLKKKLEFINALKAYNSSKTVLYKDDLKDFSRGLRSGKFTGSGFSNMKKTVNLKALKALKFKKREVDKITRALTGEKDPHRYQKRSASAGVGRCRLLRG
jgi:hypothetical protein